MIDTLENNRKKAQNKKTEEIIMNKLAIDCFYKPFWSFFIFLN